MDHGYDIEKWSRRRLVVSSGRGGDGLRGALLHHSINQEKIYDHSREDGLPAHLCTVHGDVKDVGDKPNGVLVG